MQISRRGLIIGASVLLAEASIPILTKPVQAADGYLDIVAKEAKLKLHPKGATSNLWTYNGTLPGYEIRVKKGKKVKVRFTNQLPEPTSIHWHGIRIENSMDGVSGLTQEPVEPGNTFVYEFVVPDSGTYWYHAHNKSWNQVARGLYGPLIVEEETQPFDSDHDITLVIDDWRLNKGGGLDLSSLGSLMDWTHGGRLGNFVTVNAANLPTFTLKTGEGYRLRLINVSNARVFGIDPNRFGAVVIAYDGQALDTPMTLGYEPLLIGPAQRVDLYLMPEKEGSLLLEEVSFESPITIADFKITKGVKTDVGMPILQSNLLPEPDLKNAKEFRLNMTGGAMAAIGENIQFNGKPLNAADFRSTKQAWAFNGVANLPEAPFFKVNKGETVIIETLNATVFLHAMHVHGHHFRILNRSESEIDEGQPWHDTFLIGPEQKMKIAFVADNPGKWLLHCHMLEHAAAGMNTWFEVV